MVSECGEVFTWGCNREGQLGYGTSNSGSNYTPRLVEYLKGKIFVKVAAAKYHTVVLGAEGEVILFLNGFMNAVFLSVSSSSICSPLFLLVGLQKMLLLPASSKCSFGQLMCFLAGFYMGSSTSYPKACGGCEESSEKWDCASEVSPHGTIACFCYCCWDGT